MKHMQRMHPITVSSVFVLLILLLSPVTAQSPDAAAAGSAESATPGQPGLVQQPGLLEMIEVPAGSFLMGNATTGDQNERPVHQVSLQGFSMAKTEITRAQYRALGLPLVTKTNAADNEPVTKVSWLEAITFCNALSAKEGLAPVYTIKGKVVSADFGKSGYRLPTEAEWEYAARAAGQDRLDYAGSARASEVSWYDDDSGGKVQPVATKIPNSLGLYDMSGNVWEWCWDVIAKYGSKAQVDPTGPAPGKNATGRVVRGGSVSYNDSSSRVGFRMAREPDSRLADLGFRVVRRP